MNRIVVTGMGVISALGYDTEAFASKLFAGEDGFGPITVFDAAEFRSKIAAEVPGYDENAHFSREELARFDRFAQFALLATREAVKDAEIDFEGENAYRSIVVHGTAVGGQATQDVNYHRLYAEGAKRLHPMTVPKLIPSAAVSEISIEHGIKGAVFATASACSSAAHAIGSALMLLRAGMADVAVTGGSEACISYGNNKAWEALRVMAPDTCRPFCADRTGMVIGEGAGTLILETLEHAVERGARIYAEIVGIGMSSDAHHIVQPSLEGPVRAMRAALEDAGLAPEAIGYLNAHGTATPQNDVNESKAIEEVFGDHAASLAVSSTKSMHGHALGAAAALESVAVILALGRQCVPPTANFTQADPECRLDYVPNAARDLDFEYAMSNSFAFGGLNVSLIFKRYTE